MDLPTVPGVGFPFSPDVGCLVVVEDMVLSVGPREMVTLHLITGELETVTEWQEPMAESCQYIR